MTAGLVVVPIEEFAAVIRREVGALLEAERQMTKPAPQKKLLTAAEVRTIYHVGRPQLIQMGDAGRLPFVKRIVSGGRTARLYRRDDCDRVLTDTLHKF